MKSMILAILIMADGSQIAAPMADKSACVIFTRAIAKYVQSAKCFTMPPHDAKVYLVPPVADIDD